jgi:hypothetical protein
MYLCILTNKTCMYYCVLFSIGSTYINVVVAQQRQKNLYIHTYVYICVHMCVGWRPVRGVACIFNKMEVISFLSSRSKLWHDNWIPRRVARCYIFEPKSTILSNFRGPCNEKKVGIFYGHLEYITALRYILWQFGIFYGPLEFFCPFWYIV